MDIKPDTKYQQPQYRNILHYAPSYNYTILLRAFDLNDLTNTGALNDYRSPEKWDQFNNETLQVLAATGGTYNFAQRFGLNSQISDAFIESASIEYVLGMAGLQTRSSPAGLKIAMTVREPNGMNFLPSILTAYLRANNSPPDDVLGSMHQFPVLLSVYFNLADGADRLVDGGLNLDTEFKKCTRHIPVFIKSVTFNISSSGTTYNMEMVEMGSTGMMPGTQRPLYETITQIEGKTVGEYLRNLIAQMNDAASKKNKDEPYDYKYEIEFMPGPDGKGLAFENSLLAASSDGTFDPRDKPMLKLEEIQQLSPSPLVFSNGKNVSYAQANLTGPDPANPSRTVAESIAAGEGTLRGAKDWPAWPTELPASLKKIDFDAYFGYRTKQIGGGEVGEILATIGKNKPISQMSLEQIKLFQKEVLTKQLIKVKTKNNDNEPTSPAVGGYQFIYTTLFGKNGNGGLAKDIPISEIFTPQLQTELARKLFDSTKGNNKTLSGQWAYFSTLDAEGGADLRAQGAGKIPGVNYPGASTATNAANARILAYDLSRRVKSYKPTNISTVQIAPGQTVESVTRLLALNSMYMADALKDVETKGLPSFVPFVKVYPTIDFESATPTKRNRLRQTVKFHIIPIRLPVNTEGTGINDDGDVIRALEASTIREYNYLFTGKNIDILDMNLNFTSSVNAGHIAYKNLNQTTAASDRVSVTPSSPASATQDAKTSGADSTAVTGTNISSAGGVHPMSDSSGIPKSFRNVEAEYRALLPDIFGNSSSNATSQGDLVTINLEIVGDPGLMPRSEASLNSEHFKNQYQSYIDGLQARNELHGYDPVYFRFIFGNPNRDVPNIGANLYGGYYFITKVVSNFKSSGAFTMNVTAHKDYRGFVVSKETVKRYQEDIKRRIFLENDNNRRLDEFENTVNEEARQNIEQTRNRVSNNLQIDLASGIDSAIANTGREQ